MESGITYQADCVIGKGSFERMFCGDSHQQTQTNTYLAIGAIIFLAITLAIIVIRLSRR